MKALEVFTYSIHYLHTRALEVIRERTGDENFSRSDIQWVLTVPAMWKPEAKQFMREAAYQVPRYHTIRYDTTKLILAKCMVFSTVGLVSQSVRVYLSRYTQTLRYLTFTLFAQLESYFVLITLAL